jgi:uncharacterized membrane protein
VSTPLLDRASATPLALVGLSLAGTLVSGYLTWLHLTGASALCTGLGGCEVVQSSRYAWVGPVPVALLGLGAYLALLLLALWRWRGGPAWAGLVLFGLAVAGALYSGYLTYIEVFVLGALCPWCVTSAVIILALAGLAARDLDRG